MDRLSPRDPPARSTRRSAVGGTIASAGRIPCGIPGDGSPLLISEPRVASMRRTDLSTTETSNPRYPVVGRTERRLERRTRSWIYIGFDILENPPRPGRVSP